jgi:hypothetical protein
MSSGKPDLFSLFTRPVCAFSEYFSKNHEAFANTAARAVCCALYAKLSKNRRAGCFLPRKPLKRHCRQDPGNHFYGINEGLLIIRFSVMQTGQAV